MYLHHETATEEELVSYCAQSTPVRNVIYELEGGHSVVRISRDAVVKCGFGITQEEAENQAQAYYLIDPTIIRVPRVYRYFAHEGIGYIIMEFIDGEPLNSTEDLSTCEKIVKALAHFSRIQSHQPGPLGGGIARGLLWTEGDFISPTCTHDIENYFNTRQLKRHQKLELDGQQLILCHLDIAPRNILKLENGSLCLIDWASAGYYPRSFEICTLRLNIRSQDDCNSCVLRLIGTLDEDEERQIQLLEQAYYLGQKHA
ncbi:kinase-like protein [Lizonia empirigonia]|nr:kinase-like protein [Lizonia empirigonia]